MSRADLRKRVEALESRNLQLLRLLRIARNGLAMARLHMWENEPFAVNQEGVRRIDRALTRSDPHAFGNVISAKHATQEEGQ